MVNFDEIEQVIKEVETIPPGKKYPKFVGPLQFILRCGLDKPTYDSYYAKWKAGSLDIESERCFKKIYYYVQGILADIEERTIGNLYNPTAMKLLLENWCPNGYHFINVKKSDQVSNNIEKYKAVSKLKDESNIDLK